jgi:cytochrome b561
MLLHWSTAALVLIEFATALSFGRFNPGEAGYFRAAYRMHMSAGMALLALSFSYVAWRLLRSQPPLPRDMSVVMRVAAKSAHILLYVLIIAVPTTGWFILSARNSPANWFGELHWPSLTFLARLTYEQRVRIHDLLLPMHSKLSYLGLSLIGLHVGASLYHHFWRGDAVLLRMLPGVPNRSNVSQDPE